MNCQFSLVVDRTKLFLRIIDRAEKSETSNQEEKALKLYRRALRNLNDFLKSNEGKIPLCNCKCFFFTQYC